MQIGPGLVVTIEYTLRNAAGKTLESSAERGPVTFVMGSQRMLPGLSAAIEGMVVGESRSGTIPPGALVPIATTAARRVGRNEFPSGAKPKVGDRFGAKDLDGNPVTFQVTEVTDEAVVVHLLHPLHDEKVNYEVKVLAARRASLPPPPPPGVGEEVPDMTDDLLIED